MDAHRDDRPLGQLFGDLSRQLSTLVRQEIELARTEMTEKATAAGRDAASIGIGAALAYGGVLVLLIAAILVLIELGIEPWISALLIGLAAAAIGLLLINQGRERLTQADLTPRRTIDTLKDDADWAKEQVK